MFRKKHQEVLEPIEKTPPINNFPQEEKEVETTNNLTINQSSLGSQPEVTSEEYPVSQVPLDSGPSNNLVGQAFNLGTKCGAAANIVAAEGAAVINDALGGASSIEIALNASSRLSEQIAAHQENLIGRVKALEEERDDVINRLKKQVAARNKQEEIVSAYKFPFLGNFLNS